MKDFLFYPCGIASVAIYIILALLIPLSACVYMFNEGQYKVIWLALIVLFTFRVFHELYMAYRSSHSDYGQVDYARVFIPGVIQMAIDPKVRFYPLHMEIYSHDVYEHIIVAPMNIAIFLNIIIWAIKSFISSVKNNDSAAKRAVKEVKR